MEIQIRLDSFNSILSQSIMNNSSYFSIDYDSRESEFIINIQLDEFQLESLLYQIGLDDDDYIEI